MEWLNGRLIGEEWAEYEDEEQEEEVEEEEEGDKGVLKIFFHYHKKEN